MRRSIFVLLFLLRGFLLPQQVSQIPYQSVPDFLKLPKDIHFGEVAGVALNSKGHMFVFSRGDTAGPAYGAAAAQLLEFGADGKFIGEIGTHLYGWSFAHSVKVDRDDNIWVSDKGSDMVIRFNPEGRVSMVFGRKQESSDEGTEPLRHPRPPLPPVDGMFRQVTDMAWDASGNTYISDGYINSRVAKIDKDGNWLKSWGEPGDGPDSSTLRIALQWTRSGESTWLTVATAASRCSTEKASFCTRSPLTCQLIRKPVLRSATNRARRRARWRPARLGRSALHQDQIKCCSAPMATQAESTSSP